MLCNVIMSRNIATYCTARRCVNNYDAALEVQRITLGFSSCMFSKVSLSI